MALSGYQASVQALLHDAGAKFYPLGDITIYINTARGQVALESESIRVIPAGNNTVVGQEAYSFASVQALVQVTAGVQSIIQIGSGGIAVTQGTLKPTLMRYSWADFQAYLRAINTGLQGWPAVWGQYGQGEGGIVHLYPLPSQISAMDWDCVCRPINLVDDTTAEAIPWPWSDAVQYFGAYLALLNAQRPQQADAMFKRYTEFMKRAAAMTMSNFVPDQYD